MNSSPQQPGRRRAKLALIFIALSLVALVVIALLLSPAASRDQLSWLTPAEFAQAQQVSPLTRLKYQVMRWTAPLWKSYWQNRPQITIAATVLDLSAATPWPTNAAPPFVTATNGTRAWILSPEQLKRVQAEASALPDSAMRAQSQIIITAAGQSAQISTGSPFGAGSNAVFVGSVLSLIPVTANNRIALTFGFQHSKVETNDVTGIASIKTNQTFACQAVFPNNGGLLVENPSPEPGQSNRYWLLLTAKAVDPTGRLLGQ